MATAYTSLLGLALPVTGELSGSWGDTVNDEITSLLDTAVAGTTSITADADITLTTTTGVANQSRQAIILWNPASGTTTRNITAPAQSKIYTVINASGGTQSIVFRGAGPTTGVTIVKGESAVVAWNGTDFIKVSNAGGAALFTNVTVSGTTTLSGLTASTALALDASKNVVSVTNTGTGNNVLATSPTLVTPALGTPASGVVTNLTGTASININGTVGATTANTGAFTTLTTSSTVTLNGGTANGVAFLNGSKVLTTGSALTFDGTTLGFGTTGQRITGDFSNGTLASRLAFQTSTTNSATRLTVIPSGTGAVTALNLHDASDPTNSAVAQVNMVGGESMRLQSSSFGSGTALPMTFWLGNAERARIDSSGQFLVACTSFPGGGTSTTGAAFGPGYVSVQRADATPCFLGRSNDGEVMALYSGTTQRGQVSISGATTTYGSFSDYRLKENIAALTGGLEKVMALKPSTFNFIEFPEQAMNGFIAHEVAEIEPIAVVGAKDATDESGKPAYQSVDPAKLVPLLTAAIQEQQALIQTLTARVAALESN
jgi:hypothetical protein